MTEPPCPTARSSTVWTTIQGGARRLKTFQNPLLDQSSGAWRRAGGARLVEPRARLAAATPSGCPGVTALGRDSFNIRSEAINGHINKRPLTNPCRQSHSPRHRPDGGRRRNHEPEGPMTTSSLSPEAVHGSGGPPTVTGSWVEGV